MLRRAPGQRMRRAITESLPEEFFLAAAPRRDEHETVEQQQTGRQSFLCSSFPPRAYRITLSALANTFGEIMRPICFAALRLMMNSNLIGCSTGRSAGVLPLRILSTYVAERRNKSLMLTPYVISPPSSTYSGLLYVAGSRLFTAKSRICFR